MSMTFSPGPHYIGDVVPCLFYFVDDLGNPTDPAQVALTVQQDDGSPVTHLYPGGDGLVVRTALGSYSAAITVTGERVQVSAAGRNGSTYGVGAEGAFEAQPLNPSPNWG